MDDLFGVKILLYASAKNGKTWFLLNIDMDIIWIFLSPSLSFSLFLRLSLSLSLLYVLLYLFAFSDCTTNRKFEKLLLARSENAENFMICLPVTKHTALRSSAASFLFLQFQTTVRESMLPLPWLLSRVPAPSSGVNKRLALIRRGLILYVRGGTRHLAHWRLRAFHSRSILTP